MIKFRHFRLIIFAAVIFYAISWCFRIIIYHFTPDIAKTIEYQKYKFKGKLIYDRNDNILCYLPNDFNEYQKDVSIKDVSQSLIKAIISAEDKRFFSHKGVDFIAVLRAFIQNAVNLRIVSGASTITQQVIRILNPSQRNFKSKFVEAIYALKLEMQIPKEEILELWINYAPMFGNYRGAAVAAKVLFNKDLISLDINESAIIAALPKSPTKLNPYRNSIEPLINRKNWILKRMYKCKYITRQDLLFAKTKKISIKKHRLNNLAPHYVNMVLKNEHLENSRFLKSTLDLNIQKKLYDVLLSYKNYLSKRGARQACGIIVDSKTLEVLAYVGSLNYGSKNLGFNDGILAKRSVGSLIKPFLYAFAFEKEYYPSFVLPDLVRSYKTPIGDYLPLNSNRKSYGPVSIRHALGNSLNIPAVYLLNNIDMKEFFKLLSRLKLVQDNPDLIFKYGLGLAVGNIETSLLNIVRAYGIFANYGIFKDLKFIILDEKIPGNKSYDKLMSYESIWMTLDILSDPTARLYTFGNPRYFKFNNIVALKTGTSNKYRDCWIVGITPYYIIGLWAGNFDGSPTYGLSGAEACGPILYDLLNLLPCNRNTWFPRPKNITKIEICSISGKLATKNCISKTYDYISLWHNQTVGYCDFHKSNSNYHVLPAYYASWLSRRKLFFERDKFTLDGGVKLCAPFYVLDKKENKLRIFTDNNFQGSCQRENRNISTAEVKILYPYDGDIFILSKSNNHNFIKLKAVVNQPVKEVIWVINNMEYERTPPPYITYWSPLRGEHKISAIIENNSIDSIKIRVE